MARQERIVYGIDFEVQKKSLENLKSQLNNIKNMSTKDFLKVNPQIDTKQARQQLDKIKTTAKTVETALKKSFNPKINSTNITTFNSQLQKSNLSLTEIYNDFSKAGSAGQRAFQSIANQATNFNKKIKQTHSLLDRIGITLTNTIKWNISSSLMNSVTQSIQQAWGFTKNLDSSLNDIRVVTGKSADEMARFAEKANTVASNLGKGTTDYTRAALIYAQQGLGDKEVESRTAVTLKAANVTGQSADAVSEELTAVWNGYKVSADEAELYVDRLAAVASTTASNLQELSTGMSKVASAAAEMGVGEDQLAAQLSTIISVTRQAPETVGTALRTVYARITDIKAGVEEDGTTLGQYSGKMAEMGINVLDAAGNLRDMGTVMEEIGAKWGTMTREQRTYLAQTMAGQRQYSNLVALFDNFDKYNSALKTAQNAEGTLASQNEIHMQSLNAHIQQLTTATEKMWMNLTDTDGIKNVIDSLTSIIDKVDYLFKSIGGGQNLLNSIGAIAMTLMSKNIAQGLNTTITNIKMAREETAEFKNQYKNVQEILAADDAARAANATKNNDEQQQTPLDDSFRGIIEDRGRLNQVSKAMSGEDFSETMTNLGQAADLIQRKNEILQSVQEVVNASSGELKSVEQFFDTTDEKIMSLSDTIIDNLKIREKELNKQVSNIKEQQRTLASMDFEKATKEDIKDQTELIGLSVNDAFDNLNLKNATEAEKRAIESLNDEWSKVQNSFSDTGSLQEYHKNATQILGQLRGILQGSANDVKKASEEAVRFTDEGGRKIKQEVDTIQQKIENKTQSVKEKIKQAIQTTTIQGFTQFASGLTMVQGAVNNLTSAVDNLIKTGDWGSFFSSFLISAPMLISSLTQISSGWEKMSLLMDVQIGKSAKVVAAKTAENASSVANTAANEAQKVAKQASAKAAQHQTIENRKAAAADVAQGEASVVNAEKNVEEAATKGAGGISKLGGAFKGLGSILKSLGPLLIVLAVLKSLEKWGDIAQDLANKAVEANKKIIDSENEKQEQLRKQEDVIKEVEDLNKQYEQGIITKTELKEKTKQLQQKYKDESTEIQQLVKDYKNLGQAAKQAKRKQAEQLEKSTREESKAAANTLDRKMETMHVREGGDSWTGHMSAKISGDASIGGGWNWNNKGNAAQELGNMLAAEGLGGYVVGQNIISLRNAHNDQEAFQQLQILQKFVDNATEEQKESDAYKGAQEILGAMKQDIENYKNAAEQHFEALGKKIAVAADIDFDKFDNLKDFNAGYEALAEDMRANFKAEHPGMTAEEIEEEVSKAMKEAISSEAYEKFGEKQQALNKLNKNANLGDIPDDVKSMVDALDSDQLDAFLHMDLENVESYDSIKEALEKISKLDFSNVEGLTEANLDAAIESYNKLQQILEAIQKGKKLSKKTIQEESGLTDEEIEKWFHQDVGGNYTVKAGKTQAEAEEFLKQKSVEEYRNTYKGTQKTIESNQAFLNAQEKNTVASSDWENQNQQAEKEVNRLISQDIVDKYKTGLTTKSPSSLGSHPISLNRNQIKKFISQQKEAYKNGNFKNVKIGEDALNEMAFYAQNDQWEYIEKMLQEADNTKKDTSKTSEEWNKGTDNDSLIIDAAEKINKNYEKAVSDTDKKNEEVIKNNNKNALAMLDLIQQINPNSDFAKNADYRKHAENDEITQEEFKKISVEYDKLIDQYKDANQKLIQTEEEAKKELDKIHEGLFTIDDDVDQTLVVKLGQQFQLTAKKSELLDNALESNAKKAKDVAEEVQRYNAALSSVIKNYATWQDKLSGSTADKLSVAPWIKDAMADTLGISENAISNTFATTKQNLEDMRLALEGDEEAYKRLQQAAYEDILIHIGLDDADLNEVQILLDEYFKGLNLDVAVGAKLDQAALEKVLATLIKKGINTEQQLEAIFASKGVDLDVVVTDGKAKILSYTKAATHELKQQEKSQEELKDLERERVKNQKELTKFLKDERDIYHEINRLLSDQERTIKRITRNQQDMYGTELLDNLSAESAEYKKQEKLLKSKQRLQQQDLANKKAGLASKGASFDANGNISNYNNLIGSAINNINSIISRERGVQEAMNQHLLNGGSTSDEIYKDLDAQLSSIGREKSQANDYLNDLKTDLSNYEKVKDQAEDVADQLTELSEKQIEINLKKFNMKLEVTLDLSQATKTWNDYKRNVLQHDDIFNPNRALSAQRDNAQRLADINADSQSLDVVNKQIAEAMADNGTLYKTQGQKKKAIEELQKKAIELRKGILENEDAIKQTYLEQYDIISEMFEKQKSQYDFVNNQLEHNKNMMSLVYGENDYAAQNVYNDKMIKNNLKSIESMNNRIQIAEENLRKAKESGDTAVIEKAEAEWQTAIQNRNQLEEQSAQLMKDRYTTAINQIAHQMEQKLTNNKGFNYMDTEWDLMKKQSNLYLDNINSAFAVKNTEYLYNQVLNDIKGLKSQQQLKKVMSEQLDILKEKDKLTQYDVDRAQKVLEIEKARIALEQARNNKTQMRLKRDSQGNYSYQYVADQDNIAKAENDLQKAENDLYNFDKDNYENKLKEAYDATKEYQEKITALEIEYATATEKRRKQIDEEKRLLDQQYSEYILNLSQETEWGKQNLMESTMMNFTDMMNQEQLDFENMSDAQKEKWLGDMVPSINSGIAEMIGKFSTNPDSFKQIVVEATQAMNNERQTYQEGLAELQTAAGQNWNKIKQAMDPVVELQNELIIDNDRLKDQAGEIVDAMNGTLTALDTQEKKWEKVYEQTDNAVKRVYDYIAAIDKAALKKINQDKKSEDIKDTGTQTIPTVNNLKTYGNTAPGNANSGGNKVESSSEKDEIIAGYSTEIAKTVVSNIAGHGGRFSKEDINKVNKNTKLTLQDFYEAFPNMEKSKIQDLFTGKKQSWNIKPLLQKQTANEWYNFVRNYFSDKPAVLTQNHFIRAITGKYSSTESEAKEIFKKYKQYTNTQGGKYIKFDTGGYTGDWSSTQGKLAILHQKELVLNKQDTANMLEMIQMVREMQQQELQFRLSSLNNEIQDVMKQNAQVEKIKTQQQLLEQSVSISASFPSVNSKKEIEEALSELMNKATQIALKYKKN